MRFGAARPRNTETPLSRVCREPDPAPRCKEVDTATVQEVIAMRRRLAAIASLLATGTALVLWLAVAPVTSAGDPCYHGFAMPGDTTGADVRVTLLPCAFAPT